LSRNSLGRQNSEKLFEKIKEYLMPPPVLRPVMARNTFKIYIAAQEQVIGVVLLQEEDGKEFPVPYMS
jgi:hypothetical protein